MAFEEIVNDLDRAGMPEGALRESALAHAESCSPCARLLTETESLDSGAACHRDNRRRAASAARVVESELLRDFSAAKGGRGRNPASRGTSLRSAWPRRSCWRLAFRCTGSRPARMARGLEKARSRMFRWRRKPELHMGVVESDVGFRRAALCGRSRRIGRRHSRARGAFRFGAGVTRNAGEPGGIFRQHFGGPDGQRGRNAAGDPAGVSGSCELEIPGPRS